MVLHVTVRSGGLLGPSSSEMDLSADQVRERFVGPYERGEAIVAGGRTFPPDPANLPTVEVFEGPAAEELQQEHGLSDLGLLQLAGHVSAVTGSYITKAFGSATSAKNGGGPRRAGDEPTSIFIVHGRDLDKAARVARFVSDLVGDHHAVVMLKDRDDAGRTLIEKFELEADAVAFAVVIATADDVGRLAEGGDPDEPRARQNVILELGYFWGGAWPKSSGGVERRWASAPQRHRRPADRRPRR